MKDKLPGELMKFHEGRIEFAEAKYLEASRDLEAVRPAIARISYKNYSQQLDVMLGVCYEKLGQWDREVEVYREVLRKYPDLMRVRLGEAIALDNLGRYEEAAESINALAAAVKEVPSLALPVFQLMTSAQLHKPADERDWSAVEKVADVVYQQPGRTEMDNALMKADLLMFEDKNIEARQLLTKAVGKFPADMRGWTSLARVVSRDEKTATLLPKLLERAEKSLGDIIPLRLLRIREAVTHGGDQTVAELKKLETGLDTFKLPDRVTLMNQLGMAYIQAQDPADAKRCWTYVAEQMPQNARTWQMLFELAVDNLDSPGMDAVLKSLADNPSFGGAEHAVQVLLRMGHVEQGADRDPQGQAPPDGRGDEASERGAAADGRGPVEPGGVVEPVAAER